MYGSAVAAFLAAAGGLSAQLASGHDPALGQGPAPTPATTVHRIERTVVVTTVVRRRPAPEMVAQAPAAASAPPAAALAPAAAAPAAAAPAAAAPAAAPQPTTRSS